MSESATLDPRRRPTRSTAAAAATAQPAPSSSSPAPEPEPDAALADETPAVVELVAADATVMDTADAPPPDEAGAAPEVELSDDVEKTDSTIAAEEATTTTGEEDAAIGGEDAQMREETASDELAVKTEPEEADVPAAPSVAPVKPPRQSRFSDAPVAKTVPAVSRSAQLLKRVEQDPLDGEARLALLADAESKGDLERTREVYEDFLKVFPSAAQQWIAYADLELQHGHFALVEAIFARCLRSSSSVALWKFYLDYIRRVNPVDVNPTEARVLIAKSFEFALTHVGQDRGAGEMWLEYIGFLKQGENRGSWEDQQRMDAVRKTYQRAVCIPLNSVESIWQEYNQFENGINKMTAKKFVAELSPSYMTARKALRELRAQYDRLYEPSIPRRPEWDTDREHLEMWKNYLVYEQTNPLDIEDPAALQARVMMACKRAMAAMRFFSEIWYLSSTYYTSIGKAEEASTLLRAGMQANPESLLLAYTLAEYEEAKGDFPVCYTIYDGLLAHFTAKLVGFEAATESETTTALAAIDAQVEQDETRAAEEIESEGVESRQRVIEQKEQATESIKVRHATEVDSAKRAAANVWITEMRFARRAEGIKQARTVFTKARKSPYLVWQVVEASATMELYWNKDPKIATNVFELGLKTFGNEPEYVIQYLDFLIKSNNDSNARALFERTVAKVEPAKARLLWDRWAQYEYQYGDFASAQKLFQRYSDAFPEVSTIDRFAQRHAYSGLDDAIRLDLGTSSHGQRRPRSSSPEQSGSHKRPSSPHPEQNAPLERASYNGPGDLGAKRLKQSHRDSASPAPQNGGPRPDWSRGGGREEPPKDDYDYSRSGRRRPLEVGRVEPERQIPYQLDARGDVTAVLPPAVVFFLSILPVASSFNGPILNPAALVEVISSTILPGSAAGGFQGERLGIPPRSKPAGYDSSPRPPSPRRDDRGGYGGSYGGGQGGGYEGGRSRGPPQGRY